MKLYSTWIIHYLCCLIVNIRLIWRHVPFGTSITVKLTESNMKEVFDTLLLNAVLRKVLPLKCLLSFILFCMLFITVLLNGLELEFLKNTSMASVVVYHNCSHARVWWGLGCSIAYRLISVLPSGLSGHPAAMSKLTWKLLALCIPPTLSSLNDAIGYTPNGALYGALDLWWLCY